MIYCTSGQAAELLRECARQRVPKAWGNTNNTNNNTTTYNNNNDNDNTKTTTNNKAPDRGPESGLRRWIAGQSWGNTNRVVQNSKPYIYIYITYISLSSGSQPGELTKGRKACFFANSSAFPASLW